MGWRKLEYDFSTLSEGKTSVRRQAPSLDIITSFDKQQVIVDKIVAEVTEMILADLPMGRASGKSTLRALIAQAILEDDSSPRPYEVRPVRVDE